ncbi:hypothetical protein CORC01_11417, partial [Colletotrichum orchidophilum]
GLPPSRRLFNPCSLRGSWKGDDPAGLAARNRVEGSIGEMGHAEALCFTARSHGSADFQRRAACHLPALSSEGP